MHPMGNEQPTSIPGRPVMGSNPPPTYTSFSTPGLIGSDASGTSPSSAPSLLSRPSSAPLIAGAPPPTNPFLGSRPLTTADRSTYGAPPPGGFNGPAPAPMASFTTQGTTTPQSFLNPRVPQGGQPRLPMGGPPLAIPGAASPLGSFPQTHISSVPMGPPSQVPGTTMIRANVDTTPSISSFPELRASQPQPLYGYPNMLPGSQVPLPATGSQFPTPRSSLQNFPPSTGSQISHPPLNAYQGGLIPPPPQVTPLAFGSQGQMQYPSAGPPVGTVHTLVEDFKSLSIGSAPGSLDSGVDPESLPRPLEGDMEPTSVLEMYPQNCHPRYVRLTTHAIPNSQSLLSRWHLPFGVVVHPLARAPDGEEVPVVNFGTAGIVRCRRCRTYVNPYVTFTDAGRKWRCNLCALLNDVPGEYFCPLDATGRRSDMDQRPELSRGSVEFVAPTEYMIRPPMPPIYFFLIDVSVAAVQSGLLEIVGHTIKSCLDELPGSPRTQIGFITYDSTLHFYSLKSSFTQPQMMVVSDIDDIFLPMPDDLLVNLSDSRSVVDALLESLPSMFKSNTSIESAFGPALKAAYMVMSQLGGKLLVFQSTLPSLGLGRLRLRGNDVRLYGTDKEHTLRTAEDSFYKQMAADLTKNQIAVNIYAFNDKYCDIASLGTLAKYTGGQVYYYPSFSTAIHKDKLKHELSRDLTRETAWEAVLRIRCGRGLRFTTYHGHFMLRSTDLLALPAVDCDKAFAMQLSMEETLLTTPIMYFQAALLYTSSSGERRIRVHTLQVPVVADLGEMYRQADVGAIVSLMSRLAIENTLSQKLEDARQSLQLKTVKSLREYRNLYVVQHRLSGRLIYPEALKLLLLYVLSLCKSFALRGGYADVPLDERCASGFNMMILPIGKLLRLLYPMLMRIDDNLAKGMNKSEQLPKQFPLTTRSLDPRGLYLCDNGFSIILWFGQMLSTGLVSNILGVDFSGLPDLSRATLFERDNDSSRNLLRLLTRLREEDPSVFPVCQLVRQGEQPREGSLLLSMLVEDQSAGCSSYVDWIIQMYRQAQQNS